MAVFSNKTIPDLSKLEPLGGNNYKRWSQKLLMFFEQLDIDYVLFNDPPVPISTNSPEAFTTPPVAAIIKRNEALRKYDKDNKTARCHLLNHMTNKLFDLFMIHKSAKMIWESLDRKNGSDDAGKKKYVVGKWLAFHMVDDKPIMEQVHEYENLCADVTNEGMKLCKIFLANVLLEKFPPSWNEYRNHLKHKKKDLNLQDLIGHMRTEEANRLKDKSDHVSFNSSKANLVEIAGPSNDRFNRRNKMPHKHGQGKKPNQNRFGKPVPNFQRDLVEITGEIRTGLAKITTMAILDLSYNNLSGRIPTGPQLQTFDSSTYIGNPRLCGAPLPKCAGDEAATIPQNGDNATQDEQHLNEYMLGMYISVVLGLITGFWVVCGTLMLKRSWRRAFFRYYDDMKDKIY